MAAPKRLAFLVFPRLTLLDLIGALHNKRAATHHMMVDLLRTFCR